MLLKNIRVDKLDVFVHDTRESMGEQVARDFGTYLRNLQTKKDQVNIVFAAAPSQSDFLRSLLDEKGIDWSRVNIFHMDEYIGIGIDQEQSFAGFVKKHVADVFPVGNFYPLNGKAKAEDECLRYTRLLREMRIDIVCLGIGENGHIAFNDPGEADFWDANDVKIVTLDEVCRNQQVNDKCFETIDEVPKHALSLTVPALMRADAMFCTVPAKTKAWAVEKTLKEGINDMCPASALRLHKNAKFYCDSDSGISLLD